MELQYLVYARRKVRGMCTKVTRWVVMGLMRPVVYQEKAEAQLALEIRGDMSFLLGEYGGRIIQTKRSLIPDHSTMPLSLLLWMICFSALFEGVANWGYKLPRRVRLMIGMSFLWH
jgi:hypothetical protein